MIRRVAAYILLVGVYGFVWLIAMLGRTMPRRPWKPNGRILVTGAFHNPNWYVSHITPLARSGVREVVLVVDEPQAAFENVRSICPPRWVSMLLGRVGARVVWVIRTGIRYRPDLYIGYHVMPGACSALLVGELLGRPACYQMTGGPVEVLGGGFEDKESVGGSLGRPSKLIEKMALAVVRLFDLVVVRGNKAKEFLATQGLTGSVAVITGSVQSGLLVSSGKRDIHLIFVGRLSPVKQVDQFIAVVNSAKQTLPDIRTVIVGDGPLKAGLQTRVSQLGLKENVEFIGQTRNVESLLVRSKVFVLTSKSEGLSIAMVEAMCAGVVPVVANIGELGDLVSSSESGYLVAPGCIDEYARRVVSLLQDPTLWERCSKEAIAVARGHCDIEVVTAKWRHHIHETVRRVSGDHPQEVLS